MVRYLIALVFTIAVLASPAFAAHGVVAVRRTPFRPFVGPVAVRAHVHAPVVAFRHHAFVDPFAFRGYYTPAAFYAAPAPVVYAQPAPVVAYSQPAVGYSAQSYSAYSAPQAYHAQAYVAPQAVWILPDGRSVLPNGVIVQQ